MKILAIDIGFSMGWSYRDEEIFTSGVWQFAVRKGCDPNLRYVNLWRRLEAFKEVRGMPDHVVYERPGNLFGHARKVLPAIQGIISLWALLNGAVLSDFLASEVKKYATGKGSADKEKMMAAGKRRWPNIEFITHDQCDSVFLLAYFLNKHNIDLK